MLPFIETITRVLNISNIPASQVLVQHFTLWIAFLGAILAARENSLLALTRTPLFGKSSTSSIGEFIGKITTFLVLVSLAFGSIELLKIEIIDSINIAPMIPRWFAQLIMPLGFSIMAILIFIKSYKQLSYKFLFLILFLVLSNSFFTEIIAENFPIRVLGTLIILIALINGAPIFIGLGGFAVLFFWYDFTPIAAIPAEAYRIVVSPTLPTIPLFTFAGYLLAESNTSERLVKVFREVFGWIPGGTPVVIVFLCGFFSALTGGSGVTILALGGLLVPLLIKEGYSKSFSIGLITVSGAIGLLFPPSLPVIIYGVTAGISIKSIFLAGLIPGLLLIFLISSWAIYQGKSQKIVRREFNLKRSLSICWQTKEELILPLLILFGIFGGYSTLVETASITVLYILFIEVIVLKDLKLSDIPKIIKECSSLIGGVLIILGVAMGLTSYLIDAQIPIMLLEKAVGLIQSKFLFLLLLNIFLLFVGCMMDIFSAIIVIVPLVAPLGLHFGVDPVHLAIIIIANLELGFLTPPVGMNLFLAAYRFKEDMPYIYRSTLPFFAVKFIVVMLITYVPFLTLSFF
ncbi:TRAP transporter large permease subunit [Candidatus Marinimicrobia bacterium]|nr:TRAP transporter large permease subunit [Candidatus Neomarinimicrobiota bacterium]MDC0383356.1 TRAP transporter large permease subunit [Candidatus Neomarinimicrobiota bacterium]MDC0630662.1 TRAP transporter large permease subunit [Candidatus Neomarinimicrobiota bacterium]